MYLSFIVLALVFIFLIIHNQYVLLAGDDHTFHLARTYSLYLDIKNHHLLSGLDYQTFNNRGTAFNIFYPYLTTSLPIVFFKLITNNWLLSFQLFFFFATLLTLFVTYHTSFYLTKNSVQSYLLSLLYTFSNYRIVVLMSRFRTNKCE